MGKEWVEVGRSMKYLGVMLDSRMSFRDHLEYVGRKVGVVTRALGRLMPNFRGPGERKRRLYADVVRSVILYTASVWCEALSASVRNREKLDGLMRVTNLRVIAGYRTVSLAASSLLARSPPPAGSHAC